MIGASIARSSRQSRAWASLLRTHALDGLLPGLGRVRQHISSDGFQDVDITRRAPPCGHFLEVCCCREWDVSMGTRLCRVGTRGSVQLSFDCAQHVTFQRDTRSANSREMSRSPQHVHVTVCWFNHARVFRRVRTHHLHTVEAPSFLGIYTAKLCSSPHSRVGGR